MVRHFLFAFYPTWQAAHRAAKKGWIEKRSDGWQIIEHSNTVAFIPNSFVQVSEGHSPLYRLVNGGELGPIMLAAELYQLQNLMDERGVPLDVIRGHFYASDDFSLRFERHRLHHLRPGRTYQDEKTGERNSFDRAHNHPWRGEGGSAFWDNLRALDAAHVTINFKVDLAAQHSLKGISDTAQAGICCGRQVHKARVSAFAANSPFVPPSRYAAVRRLVLNAQSENSHSRLPYKTSREARV